MTQCVRISNNRLVVAEGGCHPAVSGWQPCRALARSHNTTAKRLQSYAPDPKVTGLGSGVAFVWGRHWRDWGLWGQCGQ